MKKLLSILIAAAAAFTMSTAVYAEKEISEGNGSATITFDTEKSLDYLHTFGNASDAGLTMEIIDKGALAGKCLKLSESFKGSISNHYGGFYLDAEDFGLDSFAGYTMKMYINSSSAAAKATDQFEIFTDGEKWQVQNFLTDSAGSYRVASITVPADAVNSKIGVSFPIVSTFDGDLGYFDEITITDNYGKSIPNVGDIDNSLYQGPSGFTSVITVILFILLILAVVAGVVFFVKKVIGKYR